MASDPNLNSFGDFASLYENEDSIDLSSYISGAGNLELCSDDLFETLFPPNSPLGQELKAPAERGDLASYDEDDDDELSSCYQQYVSNPTSTCTSACSSAATSPVPFNYYNTPPVTPQPSERKPPVSPHHLQLDALASMSSPRFIQPAQLVDRITQHQQGQVAPGHRFAPRVPLHTSAAVVPPPPQLVIKPDPDHVVDYSSAYARSSVKQEVTSNESDNAVKAGTKRHAADAAMARKSKTLAKGTLEYVQKRERNNVAVRRSRDKAKQKAAETQRKVQMLTAENNKLHERVAELSHELNTLKNLLKSFPHVSA